MTGGNLVMTVQQWLDHIDESLVKSFYEAQDETERKAGFEETLSFGTAGIRSTFGLGPGRLNAFTIRKVAYGLAQYLTEQHDHPSIVIHFDTRLLSQDFAEEMAGVLARLGVKVTIADRYKSTPELSFAVRHLQTDAGVMITASHNPKNYNGIKVYDHTGGQLLPEPSEALSQFINAIEDPLEIEGADFNQYVEAGQIEYMSSSVTEAYKDQVKQLVGEMDEVQAQVILTSLHGTSLPILSDILLELGYDAFTIEREQSQPDGQFPTIARANPEDPDAFERALQLAEQQDAELAIATDPDADRFGFVERYGPNAYRYFNGNEIGLLLMKLRFQALSNDHGPLYIVKSVVTGALSEALAKSMDVEVVNVLTGFKYISNVIESRKDSDQTLLLGFEESHGYLTEPFTRDKDAIQVVPLIIKFKNMLKANGLTFKDALEDIYQTLGRYKDQTVSPTFEGAGGSEKMDQIMKQFRSYTGNDICGLTMLTKEDYLTGELTHIEDQSVETLDYPTTNLIRFTFNEGFIAIRPSGTEPKLKLYFSLAVDDLDDIVNCFNDTFME